MKLIGKTFYGLENLLANEIRENGGQNIEPINRAVLFEGDLHCLYKLNLRSRLGLKFLKPLVHFTAHNETVLYKRVRRYDWTKLIDLHQTFAINSVVSSENFSHSKYVALKVKDAIVDFFRYKYNGKRPSIDTKNPDFLIEVYCRDKEFTISLDSTGESRHKRGYRTADAKAPLNEILAAGMVMLSGWSGDEPLLDPMCGSCTILTEAMMIAHNTPPLINRDHFLFMNWEDYDQKLWSKVRVEAMGDKKIKDVTILGWDQNEVEIKQSLRLISDLGYRRYIKLSNKNFIDSDKPMDSGTIVTNPPYGKRLNENDIYQLYSDIGNTLKKKYTNWSAWLISGNLDAMKKIGLRSSSSQVLYNGALKCKFQKFEMYKGSRKVKQD